MSKKQSRYKTTYESYAGQRFAVFYSELIDHPTFTSMTGCAQALLIRFHCEWSKTLNKLGDKNGELQFSTSRLKAFINSGEKKR